MTTCTCTPGTNANGWHEHRCDACAAADSQVWAEHMRRSQQMIMDMAGLSIDEWRRQGEARRQRQLYDYLGMNRAR